jgi:hypothetical protein
MTMKSKKKKQTVAEFLAELEKNPTFRAQRQEREEAFRRRHEELRQAQAPLVQALAEVGLEVESVWDLVNRPTRHYPEAVPVLLDHLQRPYPDAIRDGIARALTVADARPHWKTLTRLYREEHGRRTKDGLAVAISGIATDEVIEDVIALARDKRNGTSRVLLLYALERSKDPRAQRALMELGTDPELQKQIQIIFKRKKRSRR